MITLHDISKNNFSYYDDFNDTTKKNQIEVITYIKHISSQMNIPIDTWDIPKVFGGTRSKLLITRKPEINKRLFEYNEHNKGFNEQSAMMELLSRESHMREYLTPSPEESKDIKRVERNLRRIETDLASGITNRSRAGVRRCKWTNALRALNNRPDFKTTLQELARITKAGFWKFLRFEEDCFIFASRNPIILTNINKNANLDMRLNMGHYKIKIGFNYMSPLVFPYKDNILYRREHIHPYVSGIGDDICWGNTSGYAATCINDKKLYELMEVTAHVLSTYSDGGGPHVALHNYYNNHKRVDGYYYKEDKEHEDKYSSTETIRELLTIKIPERKKRDGMDDLAITLGGTTVSVRTNPVRIEEPHEEDDYDDDYEDEDCW